MAGVNPSKLPPPSSGKTLTILSIDGGGIRGLIPTVALQALEDELKRLDGQDARIADYFDVIAGTSTGGLIATMLTTPDSDEIKPRPKFTTADVRRFYVEDGPLIFPDIDDPDFFQPGPKHHGEHLRTRLRQELGSITLDKTLTHVVIPTFDINRISPTIFSTFKAKEQHRELNASLYDICIATSAAPTYLPAHGFKVKVGNVDTEYHMIDGGIAAGNPTLTALSEVGQEKEKHPELYPMMERADDYSNVLLVSLGCGVQAPDRRPGYTAVQATAWSRAQWATPILEFYYDGAMDTMDYYIFSLFKANNADNNYLRLQADTLTPDNALMDNAKPENLEELIKRAKEMLEGPVKRINPVTFALEPTGQGTYHDALKRVAERLVNEKKDRIGAIASN